MKTIKQLVCDQAKHLPTRENESVDPSETLRLRLETYFGFWASWLVILYPLGSIYHPYMTVDDIFDGGKRASIDGRAEGAKLLARKLGVNGINFNTFFKVRHIIAEAVQEAKRHEDVDIALCALMTFVQLELGVEPDPEYGQFPEREWSPPRFSDADLSDDPIEAEMELDLFDSAYQDFGTSEYLLGKWFFSWKDIIDDPERFESKFPGAGHRRANVARALAPIFSRLDSVLDGYVLDLFLRWAKPLLRRPFKQNRVVASPSTAETEAA